MRLIDAYKLYPDCLTKTGRLAISQSQIAEAPTVEQLDDTELQRAIGYSDGYLKGKEDRPTGEWKDHRWCSNCGCGIPTDVYGGGITEEEAHFCVECGADMRGGKG